MRDLIFITAFCPTEEQEKRLDECVDSVLSSNWHVALISHTHIPIHIQKKCNYYFYDYLNDTSDDVSLLGHRCFVSGDMTIQSRFFSKFFYGFAIYRMFSIASQIAINFGYKNIHHIEYDCRLLDKSLIEENSDYLEEYDSVIHTHNGKEDGFLFGSFKSFNVSSLPDNFKNYSRDFIENEMRLVEPKHLEVFTKNLFMRSGKVLFRDEPSNDRFGRSIKFYNRNLHFTLYYNPSDKTLSIFYNSIKESSEEIVVIINKNNVINIKTKPGHWHVKTLGNFDDINHVRIDNSEKVIYDKTFDSESRELFKIKSHITNEKNN
jgi:hypothetical protein